jgi:DNA-binding GntR family transcriptional regulator
MERPIVRRLLRDDVYQRLREEIITGRLAPGEQLRDAELAASLGVSRTPVREALLRLAEAGLVIAAPGRSTMVSELDPRRVAEARDVVAAMHELAVLDSVGRLTESDIAAMRDANERFRAAIDADDPQGALVADERLHAVPVEVAGNRALASVLKQYSPVVRRAELLRFSSADGRASIARHTRLIDLCERGDAEGAAKLAFDTWHSLTADSDRAPADAGRRRRRPQT